MYGTIALVGLLDTLAWVEVRCNRSSVVQDLEISDVPSMSLASRVAAHQDYRV